MKDTNCPYCNAEIEICHDDGFGCAEGEAYQMECPHCEKNFIFYTTISFDYSPQKADCLNGAEHKWKATITCPKTATRMRCTMCDQERKPTEEEMKIIMGSEQ
jgi:hypothetical protein